MKKFAVTVAGFTIILLGAFLAFNYFIYNEKQAEQSKIALKDSSWIWTSTLLTTGEAVTPKDPERFVLTFSPDGSFGSSTDCNTMGGMYSIHDRDQLTFGNMYSTKMYCAGSQEDVYADQLANVASYTISNDGSLMLTLKEDQGTMVFTYRPKLDE